LHVIDIWVGLHEILSVWNHAAKKREQGIPKLAGVLDLSGAQREPQALLGEVGQVDRAVAPEGAVVIPEMVVGVAGLATDGQFRFLIHRCMLSGAHAPGGAENKKAAGQITTASGFQGEYFFSNPRGSPHICRFNAPTMAPLPSLKARKPGHGPKPTPLLMQTLKELRES
jgi:hypothetical protein